jgi:hypothetical protein
VVSAVLGSRRRVGHRERDAALNTAILTTPNLSEGVEGHRSLELQPLLLCLELHQPALLTTHPARQEEGARQ